MDVIASKIEVYISQEKKIYPLLLEERINMYFVATTYQAFHKKHHLMLFLFSVNYICYRYY